jgi:hypothetical protein
MVWERLVVVIAALTLFLALSGRHSSKSESDSSPETVLLLRAQNRVLQQLLVEVRERNRVSKRLGSGKTLHVAPSSQSRIQDIMDRHYSDAD